MKNSLFIFIGGSDEQNGDYSRVLHLARRPGIARWSSLKAVRPGDRALIYIQRPHSALVAKADVLDRPAKGKPGDYPYRVKVGNFELLPNRSTIDELRRAFPGWAWLRYPRRGAAVPHRIAAKLWKLVHEKASDVQIVMGAVGWEGTLRDAEAKGRSVTFSVPRLAAIGDSVLFYLAAPISAIVAAGKAVTAPRATERKWYEARIGNIRMLDSPIPLAELRDMFPEWAWLRSVNMFAYVSPFRAGKLLTRSKSRIDSIPARQGGAGFGDTKTNRLVEKAAVQKATHHLRDRGYTVRSRELENLGYDLDAMRGAQVLHVEVKGISGSELQFPITANEVRRSKTDPAFRLMAVTQARTRKPSVYMVSAQQLHRAYRLRALAYLATKK